VYVCSKQGDAATLFYVVASNVLSIHITQGSGTRKSLGQTCIKTKLSAVYSLNQKTGKVCQAKVV